MEEEKKKVQIKEIQIDKPTRRVNFSFVAHPLKEELFLFGGEYFNGQKVCFFFFHVVRDFKSSVKAAINY